MISCKAQQEKQRIVNTIAFIIKNGLILLGMKKVRLGAGRFNGFGGHRESNETIEEAATREFLEETSSSKKNLDGIKVRSLIEVGYLEFRFRDTPEFDNDCHIFLIKEWEGRARESDEMIPKWVAIDEIPYDLMWQSDRRWLPTLLDGEKFRGWFLYDSPESGQLLDYKLEKL
jgi:8-oxo-dGTP diphosphatase